MGKIAKPQRSRKHKKIKAVDPFYTGDRPIDRNADTYNKEPRHETEQEFSRSVREIMELKKLAKMNSFKKKKKRRHSLCNPVDDMEIDEKLGVMERGVTKPFKPVPEFKKRKGESDKAFLHRVDRETAAVIQKAKFEDKYDVDIDDLDNDKKHSKQTEEGETNKKKLRLKNRKAKLIEKKKQKREDRYGGFASLKDDVRFGEVAHQPPTFTAKPRKASKDQVASRPGTKPLLLTKMLSGSSSICDEDSARQRDGARRHLSLSERVMLEAERERVVQLYRDIKNQQKQNRGTS